MRDEVYGQEIKPMWNYSELDASTLSRLKSAETELGITLLAVQSADVAAAEMTDAQVKRLKEFEQELGLVLVAVK